MAEAALIAKGVSAVAGGLGAMGAARSEKQRADANAYIGETRAIQSSTVAAENTNSELATMRATMGANSQGLDVGTMPVMQELRRVRGREKRINVANERQTSADYRMQGRAALSKGRAGLISGLASSGQSFFDLYQLRQR